mmetsp:Transcript_32939/g.83611  ORF Transcript_32939/g.83611 Transcript_32939/m.83611 type:complete len:296 (-) Transcript_32939:502-1389(-)
MHSSILPCASSRFSATGHCLLSMASCARTLCSECTPLRSGFSRRNSSALLAAPAMRPTSSPALVDASHPLSSLSPAADSAASLAAAASALARLASVDLVTLDTPPSDRPATLAPSSSSPRSLDAAAACARLSATWFMARTKFLRHPLSSPAACAASASCSAASAPSTSLSSSSPRYASKSRPCAKLSSSSSSAALTCSASLLDSAHAGLAAAALLLLEGVAGRTLPLVLVPGLVPLLLPAACSASAFPLPDAPAPVPGVSCAAAAPLAAEEVLGSTPAALVAAGFEGEATASASW